MASEDSHTADSKEEVESPDVHFEPIVQLPPVEVVTLEEEEEELIQMRAKLFRFDNTEETPQWKERGTGTAKLLRHTSTDLVRILMRRDKTLKICANHYVHPEMELKPNCGSDKAWVWTTQADFSDGEAKSELLAIRFANAENAQKWKQKFTEAQEKMKKAILAFKKNSESDASEKEEQKSEANSTDNNISEKTNEEATKSEEKSADKDTDNVAEKLETLTVNESGEHPDKDTPKKEATENGTDASLKKD